MSKPYSLLIIALLGLASCTGNKLPRYIGEKPYDLSQFDVKMNVPEFYSDKSGRRLNDIEPVSNGEIGLSFSSGFRQDSVAYLGSIYYCDLNVLTTPDSSLMAVWAESDAHREESFYQPTLHKLTQQYGDPVFEYEEHDEWGTRYFVWELPDRVLQFEVSSGFRFSTDADDINGRYYDSEVIIVKNEYLKQLAEQLQSSDYRLCWHYLQDRESRAVKN